MEVEEEEKRRGGRGKRCRGEDCAGGKEGIGGSVRLRSTSEKGDTKSYFISKNMMKWKNRRYDEIESKRNATTE